MCDFKKGYSTQHCLLAMLEKWKKVIDKGKGFGRTLDGPLKVLIH